MKVLVILIFIFTPVLILAQQETPRDTTQGRIVMNEDTKECVAQVYQNPDAIKLLLVQLMNDKDYMRKLHKQLMADPEVKKGLEGLMRENKNMMRHDSRMHEGRRDNDTTGIKRQ